MDMNYTWLYRRTGTRMNADQIHRVSGIINASAVPQVFHALWVALRYRMPHLEDIMSDPQHIRSCLWHWIQRVMHYLGLLPFPLCASVLSDPSLRPPGTEPPLHWSSISSFASWVCVSKGSCRLKPFKFSTFWGEHLIKTLVKRPISWVSAETWKNKTLGLYNHQAF